MLNYKEYGEGEAVIILHGLLGMLDNWHSFARKLSAHYHVITLDQRNHGKSFHSDEFSYPILSDDLNNFLNEHGIDKCHLIGHSMGGKTVMQFQADHPQKIDKSIIVDIAPKEYSGGHEHIFKALLTLNLNEINSRKEATDYIDDILKNKNVTLFLLKNLKRNDDKSFKWKANIEALWKNYDDIKTFGALHSKIDLDTLFIRGSDSNYILDTDLETIRSIYSKAQIQTVQGSGHWVHAEKPDALLKHVTDFF